MRSEFEICTDLVGRLDLASQKCVVEQIEEDDPALAEEIKKRIVALEDILLLSDREFEND